MYSAPGTPHGPPSAPSPRGQPRLDAAIQSIQPKCLWGFSALPEGATSGSLLALADNEFLLPVGSNLCIYSSSATADNKPSKLILPQIPDACHVTYMTLSSDGMCLAVCFKVRGESQTHPLRATIYLYDMKSHHAAALATGGATTTTTTPTTTIAAAAAAGATSSATGAPPAPQKPRVLSHTFTPPSSASISSAAVFEELDSIEQHQFTTASFSHDNILLACATNISSVGCLIFDAIKGEVMLEISTATRVSQISFNPRDSQKLCTIGEKNLFQLWRLASKNVHPSPIHGLSLSSSYTSLVWLDGEESRIVAGSKEGFLVIVQGTEQLQQPCYAFGAPTQQGSMPSKIVSLLTRGDYIVAVSEFNFFSLLEIKRFSGSGAQPATAVLIPLGIFQLSDIDVISGMQWAVKMAASSLQYSFVAVVASSSSLSTFDIKADTMGSKAGLENGGVSGPLTMQGGNSGRLKSSDTTSNAAPVVLKVVKTDQPLTNFHSGAINSLSIAGRNATIVSASHDDETIRVRNFSEFNGPCQVVSSFHEFKNQIPNFVDVHPSGLFIASACEDEAVEFVIADNGVGAIKRIPVKIPFTLPNGTPFVNTQPVSIVRYSHSGHLLAVVTGKFARVFDMVNMDIASSSDLGSSPKMIMCVMDNTGNITDLAFSKDDARIFTTAADGFVYSWAIGETVRSGEFNHKGFSATKIATSTEGLIAAVFESDSPSGGGVPGSAGSALRKASVNRAGFGAAGSGKRGLVNSRRGPAGGGATSSRKNSILSATGSSSALLLLSGAAPETLTAADTASIPDAIGDNSSAQKSFLVFWQDNVSISKGEFVHLETPVTAISLGSVDAPTRKPVCVVGLADGRVMISLLPFPLRSFSPTIAGLGALFSSSNSGVTGDSYLDESKCKVLQLHKAPVSCIVISVSGLWIFSASNDGSVYMLSTSIRARDLLEIPEFSTARENDYVITEKEQLSSLRSRIADVETVVAEMKRDSERIINKLTESAAETKAELEKRMKNDIKKRDEIIIRGREDLIKSNKEFNAQISKIKTDHAREISELESIYEKKLSKEGLYLEKMRQAYDEFVLHARMDMEDLRAEVEKEKKSLESQNNSSQKDAEKQKAALLLYVDFVNERNKEVLNALEEHQDNERSKLKDQLSESTKAVERSQQEGRSEIATLTIQNGKLKHTISSKEDEIMKMQSDLGWANERIKKLEMAIGEASSDMRKKVELMERWEFKAGEAQQQISELERIRKALTSQLHGLRQELGPKEEKLSQVSERLQEVDREYELSLHAISEKEKTLNQQSQNLALLKKQVRDYRSQSARRDLCLRRAAKLLDEFKLALEEAQFKSYKKTVQGAAGGELLNIDAGIGSDLVEQSLLGGAGAADRSLLRSPATKHRAQPGQVIEMMAKTDGMDNSLRRLSDLLYPYLKIGASVDEDVKEDEVLAAEERERQLKLLHKSIRGLQSNLENTSVLAQTKVGSHLSDNRILLEEINMLRQQVRSLSLDNQRLQAKMEFADLLQRRESSQVMHEYTSATPKLLQDSQSDASLQKGGNGRLVGGGSVASLTKSKSTTDSNIIQLTGGSKLELQLSASNSMDNIASSISLEAQRTAIELRDQILSKLNDVKSTPGSGGGLPSGTASAPGRQAVKSREDPLSRAAAADRKIAAIMKENEDAIREGAAAEILASYQKQILHESASKGKPQQKAETGRSMPSAIVPKKAVPLSIERVNKHVALPQLQ